MYGLGFLFYKFCFENISIFLAYFAMEYLCYVSMTSFFFLKPIVVSQKEKKGGGGGNVRSLRLKNWLPLESTNIYKVVRS